MSTSTIVATDNYCERGMSHIDLIPINVHLRFNINGYGNGKITQRPTLCSVVLSMSPVT